MKTTPYELVFGQPPRLNIFPGVKVTPIMEEDVEELFVKDEEMSLGNFQCKPDYIFSQG